MPHSISPLLRFATSTVESARASGASARAIGAQPELRDDTFLLWAPFKAGSLVLHKNWLGAGALYMGDVNFQVLGPHCPGMRLKIR